MQPWAVVASPDLPYNLNPKPTCLTIRLYSLFLDPLVAFVTEDCSLPLETFSSLDFHDTVFSFGFVQLLWLLFLSLFLSSLKYSSATFFRTPFSSYPTLLCASLISWLWLPLCFNNSQISISSQILSHIQVGLYPSLFRVPRAPQTPRPKLNLLAMPPHISYSLTHLFVFFFLELWQNTPKFPKEET